ncbi:MAG: DUF4347 domain-containing protein, partial [Opitutae bacterium]
MIKPCLISASLFLIFYAQERAALLLKCNQSLNEQGCVLSAHPKKGIVFYDPNLPGIKKKLDEIRDQMDIFPIGSEDDFFGISAKCLFKDHNYIDLHILAHGQAGKIFIGKKPIDENALRNNSSLIENWGIQKIYLWSCNVGREKNFIDTLKRSTEAKVFCSIDTLGRGRSLQGTGSPRLESTVKSLDYNLHTNGVGLIANSNGNGSFDVTIIYGSYHKNADPEGALSLYDENGLELFGQGGTQENQTFVFQTYPNIGQKNGLSNAEIDSVGFTRGVDFFGVVDNPSFGFTDDLESSSIYRSAESDKIVALQQVTINNVFPGTYYADYDVDPVGATAKSNLSKNWDAEGIDAAAGGDGFRFVLSDDGKFTFPVTNSPPILEDSIESVVYIENQPAIALNDTITLTDADEGFIDSAEIRISDGFQSTEDFITFSDQNGISHSFDAVSGVLSLTGRSTIEHYESALQTVSY